MQENIAQIVVSIWMVLRQDFIYSYTVYNVRNSVFVIGMAILWDFINRFTNKPEPPWAEHNERHRTKAALSRLHKAGKVRFFLGGGGLGPYRGGSSVKVSTKRGGPYLMRAIQGRVTHLFQCINYYAMAHSFSRRTRVLFRPYREVLDSGIVSSASCCWLSAAWSPELFSSEELPVDPTMRSSIGQKCRKYLFLRGRFRMLNK